MKQQGKWNKIMISTLVLVALMALPALASAATYYVDDSRPDNTGDGLTQATAWKTITYAATQVSGGTLGAPDIINVLEGTYDSSTNGEVFPINFTNGYVSLVGYNSGTKTIDGETSVTLDVDAIGFSVSGFTFTNAPDAIDISAGGFSISNNIFAATVGQGIYFSKQDTDRSTSVTFGVMSISGNTFNTSDDGIHVNVDQDFDDITENLTASFGNFTIANNTFTPSGGQGIEIKALFNISDLPNGTITVGDFTVSNNTFTGAFHGMNFESEIKNIKDTALTIGNTLINDNTFTDQHTYGIRFDNYWALHDFFGTTTAVLGDLTFSNNTITSDYATHPSTHGMHLEHFDNIYYINDQATVTTGAVTITGNTIDVNNDGLYFKSWGVYYIGEEYGYDTSTITTGARTISNNTVTSNGAIGIYMNMEYIGYEMWGNTRVTYGAITVSNNTVTSDEEALYFSLYESGYDMNVDSALTMGAVTFSGNTLTSATGAAFYYEIDECSYDTNDNTVVTFGPTSIVNNTLTSTSDGEGLYFYFEEFAYQMYDASKFIMSAITIDNNTITATDGDGIYIEYYEYYVASYMEDTSNATLPDWIISQNTIDVAGTNQGIELYTYSNPDDNYNYATAHYGSMLIDNNTFNANKDAGMDSGIYLSFEDVVKDGYYHTTTTFGDITISSNTFYAVDSKAIYIGYDEVGYSFSGAPTLTMGDIIIKDNAIDTTPIGIDILLYDLSTEESAKVTIGDLDISKNTLSNISNSGIQVEYYNVNDDPTTAMLTIGAPSISNNTISGTTASGDGISLEVVNNTTGITFGSPTISGNTVSGFANGLNLNTLEEATISCNTVGNNSTNGMLFDTDGSFTVVYNSLLDNTMGLRIDAAATATINAEKNWWGDAAGPAACASCNKITVGGGTVDFTPWLSGVPKSPCSQGFPWGMLIPAFSGIDK